MNREIILLLLFKQQDWNTTESFCVNKKGLFLNVLIEI
jgi:hypothetical protein